MIKQSSFLLILVLSGYFLAAQEVNKETLVKQLTLFKKAVTTRNKAAIADYFSFPLYSPGIGTKIQSSLREDDTIRDTIDRKTFYTYCDAIILDDFKSFFDIIQIEKLKTQDEISKTIVPTSDKIAFNRIYRLKLSENLVSFSISVSRRTDIATKGVSEGSSQTWVFRIVNGKLKFEELVIVG